MKSSLKLLIAFCLCPSVAFTEGLYGSVPIDEDELRELIESSYELEGYFAGQSIIFSDEELLGIVRDVGHSLTPPPTDLYINYEFFILRDASPQAFALPNGHIYISTGMLARLEDESQLAAVLSHEINHVAGHHGIVNDRSVAKKRVALTVLSGISTVMPTGTDIYGDFYCPDCAFVAIVADAVSVSLAASVFGFSRELEQEADNFAAVLMLDSPYDPHALPEIFEILRQDYEGLNPRVPTTWSTHPELELRAEIAHALVDDLPRRERESDAYQIATLPLRAMTIRDYVQDDYPHTALALAESLAERYPDDARMRLLLADAWQSMGANSRIDPEEWSNRDKRHNLRQRAKRTREQRMAELLEDEEGRAAYQANMSMAEKTYREVLAMDPSMAQAHRGLGEVYENLDRPRDAADEYLTYARAEPDAPDRTVIIGRLRGLTEQIREQQEDEE